MVVRRRLGEPGRTAQDGAEVVHVVADVLAPVRRDQEVQGVDGARVVVRQPGGEHMIRPQLAAVLVRVDVVRVVAAGAVVLEVPDGLAVVEARGGEVDAPLTVARPRRRIASRSRWLKRRRPEASRMVAFSEILILAGSTLIA